jgi:polyhydroxyalkanoate synthesis regulator phasin
MRRSLLAGLLVSALAGCWKAQAEDWKDKFIREVNYHYQTQQQKNAEIAARDLEIENQKSFIAALNEKIAVLEERVRQLERSLEDKK